MNVFDTLYGFLYLAAMHRATVTKHRWHTHTSAVRDPKYFNVISPKPLYSPSLYKALIYPWMFWGLWSHNGGICSWRVAFWMNYYTMYIVIIFLQLNIYKTSHVATLWRVKSRAPAWSSSVWWVVWCSLPKPVTSVLGQLQFKRTVSLCSLHLLTSLMLYTHCWSEPYSHGSWFGFVNDYQITFILILCVVSHFLPLEPGGESG